MCLLLGCYDALNIKPQDFVGPLHHLNVLLNYRNAYSSAIFKLIKIKMNNKFFNTEVG